ncbi:PIG-L deacetylase family protein [Lentzea flaviverrucosa]|uniref:N-acetylglucosaminyl deacetylase, LmbE family n=1 Tax=Lentzea flaviverrucosa TaxID=200379 RepID=A0A1H9WTS7_9PSEU|nr:PIG-L deacetylase family protein [Lentzea flaviverrucosa]RDI23088.1 LmbE family N-acetylglucosaminyl deacetylase [Lentzea flaviverrucosa]SES37201.1 N-acetylglucosaminyl deacetylase, LmbE family [Lentzea flaviverrucosa]
MRVLVIAAHPDDEVLGAGATIAALTARGVEVTVLIVAEGVSLRHDGVTLAEARALCHKASSVLGVTDVRFGGLAVDGLLPGDGPQRVVVGLVEQTIRDVAPQVVYSHHPGDVHVDHRMIAQAVTYATRLMAMRSVVQVLHFEVPSSTEQQTGLIAPFEPDVFHDITPYVDLKCEALETYRYEVYDAPHPRSPHGVRALAAYRGTQVGVFAAEAFVLGRQFTDFSGRGAVSCVS